MAENKKKFYVPDVPFIVVAEDHEGGKDIILQDLTVKTPGHNGRALVENVNLTIEQGSRVILTGESGCGKTTVTKAILNQWDDGSGLVVMPENVKILSMSQRAYFANSTVRSILNMAPEDQAKFSDEELTTALHAVGHDNLIQHIPGQQVKIMIDDLCAKMPEALQAFQGQTLTEETAAKINDVLKPLIGELVHEQFSVVQYVPEQQKAYFAEKLAKALNDLQIETPPEQLAALSDRLVHDTDMALTKPLYDHLAKGLEERAEKTHCRLLPFTSGKADYLAWNVRRKTAKKMKKYMANEDTDDQARPIRINKAQADFITATVSDKVREMAEESVNNSTLSRIFNAVTWPLTLVGQFFKAGSIAKDNIERTTFFMDRQVLTGDNFTLSGGERQKLMIAMVLLHKPDILILDEITAALDRETGEKLYSQMMDQIPQETTVISIAHNEHIRKFHTHHARLANKTITVTEIGGNEPAQQQQPPQTPPAPGLQGPAFG